MLHEKLDIQFTDEVLPIRDSPLKSKQTKGQYGRFPSPDKIGNISKVDLLIPKLQLDVSRFRPGSIEKIRPESTQVRGPKVCNKRLPEVFLFNKASNIRIREKLPHKLKEEETQTQSNQNNSYVEAILAPYKREKHRDFHMMSPSSSSQERPEVFFVLKRKKSSQKNSHNHSTNDFKNFSIERKKEHQSLLNIDLDFEKLSMFSHKESAHHHRNKLYNDLNSCSSDSIRRNSSQRASKNLHHLHGIKFFPQLPHFKLVKKHDMSNHSTSREKSRSMASLDESFHMSDFVTLKKVKTTRNNGIVKRMLHVPSFKVMDLQEEMISEFGLKENSQFKSFLDAWKDNFSTSEHLMHIYCTFWNSPEGCVSIVTESTSNGLLSDLMRSCEGLPENCMQDLARNVLQGIREIHKKTLKPHGFIKPEEIMITQGGRFKIMPSICSNVNTLSHKDYRGKSLLYGYGELFVQTQSRKGIEDIKYLNSRLYDQTNFAQDVFDFGLLLLQCAIGDFTLYDFSSLLTIENIQAVIRNSSFQKRENHGCCLIHSENLVRKALRTRSETPEKSPAHSKRSTNNSLNIGESGETRDKYRESYMPLLEVLRCNDRFSQNFEDFLCSCLRLNASKRMEVKHLLNHKFLEEENNMSKGAYLNIKELLLMNEGDNSSHKDLEKVKEIFKVALLNEDLKEKCFTMFKKSSKLKIYDIKLVNLAKEINVPVSKLENFIQECIQGG